MTLNRTTRPSPSGSKRSVRRVKKASGAWNGDSNFSGGGTEESRDTYSKTALILINDVRRSCPASCPVTFPWWLKPFFSSTASQWNALLRSLLALSYRHLCNIPVTAYDLFFSFHPCTWHTILSMVYACALDSVILSLSCLSASTLFTS